MVYKILSRGELDEACRSGAYEGSRDDVRDGFIHLSDRSQLDGTLAKHFRGRSGLVLVAFDAETLGPALVREPSRGGALFPHLYAPLPAAAGLQVWELPLGGDGIPALPEDLSPC